MKIALLMTGQLRTVDMVKYLHLHAIIEKYDTDVFLSINCNNEIQCLNKNSTLQTKKDKVKEIIDFFKPISYFVSESYVCESPYKLVLEQYFIVHNGYQLIKDTNNHYDLIVRLRFDQFLCNEVFDIYSKLDISDTIVYNEKNTKIFKELTNYKINFYQALDNEIYVFGQGQFTHFHYVNDQFFYHNMSLLDTMLCFYKELPELMDLTKQNGNTGLCIIEHAFSIFLKRKQINIKTANLKCQFIRELT